MKFTGKFYEILKWSVLIFLPALSTTYCMIAPDLGLPAPDTVAKVISAVCFFIGSMIGVSTATYYKDEKANPNSEVLDSNREEK